MITWLASTYWGYTLRADRILAVLLIALSFIAAIGTWMTRPKTSALELAGGKAGALGGGGAEVAIFDLNGSISNGKPDDFGGDGIAAAQVVPLLRQAEKDGVKAILLRINSPGGTAAASQAIYEELMRLRKADKIKIVAVFGDIGASGAYYIAAAAHEIMALPGSTVGSIGVIAHVPNFQGLMGKIGMQDQVIKSGAHKDIMSPFRGMDPSERAIIQALVDDTYAQFLEAITAGRPKLTRPKLAPLADGRIFTGRQAAKVGLIDALGTYSDALKRVASLAGLKAEPETRSYTERSLLDYVLKLQSRFGGTKVEVDLGGATPARFPARIPLAVLE